MSVKTLVLDCECNVQVCKHAYKKVSDLLQSGYDDGYDEGWADAFVSIKEGLTDLGYEDAAKMKTPPAPPRSGKLRSPGTNRKTYTN